MPVTSVNVTVSCLEFTCSKACVLPCFFAYASFNGQLSSIAGGGLKESMSNETAEGTEKISRSCSGRGELSTVIP